MNQASIDFAIEAVKDGRVKLYDAIEEDTRAQHALEDERNNAVSDGLYVGCKNEGEREARASIALADQIGLTRVTSAKVRYAKLMLDQAQAELDRVRYTIRLMEVENQ